MAANVETDWDSFFSSESGLPPAVFPVVKEEEEETTESKWKVPDHCEGVWGKTWETELPARCKEEREDGKSGMVKLKGSEGENLPYYIPDSTLARLTVKELKKSVEYLGREEVAALKVRRRTLKNRGYAVQCRLRRQQYKDGLETQVRQLQEQLKKMEDERNFFREFYHNCCGQRHPLNLQMANNSNNYEAGDYKMQNGEDMSTDFDLSAGGYREDRTGKVGERFRGDQLVQELLAAGENPTALGVSWREEERGDNTGKLGPEKICKQQVGQSNGLKGLEAVGRLPASTFAVEEEAVREALGLRKVAAPHSLSLRQF